ncbi:DMSO reductase [Gordonibacter sp. 28C]|uniref:dimethyl sulfoxide reductase anchor subunit family protein n=1 Tax=Gordonibacter sp. 28C TaxID=2078569 RepID=UPI000DF79E77|nr:DmsC/YnfH family molybdoenzyme membrane anchor subunit [Gordonibacter sp. 28C]RDB64700.1 DMSO reductase [Gordonibacter sp. 28C]
MASGFDELSLAVFTTLAPAGTVAFVVLALARLFSHDHEAAVRIDRLIALPFSVALVGFIASATHLGTPANALHVFSGVGRSPLSNEVLSAVAFLFLVGSYWMMAFKQRFPDAVAKPWLVLACVAGAALVACTSLAYAVDTVPTWDTWYAPANLWFSALLAGPALGLLFLHMARVPLRGGGIALVAVCAAALAAGTIVLALHQQSLGGVANNELVASALVPNYGGAIAFHAFAGAIGCACAALSLRHRASGQGAVILSGAAALLLLVAVFVTRVEFYQLHMTVGF